MALKIVSGGAPSHPALAPRVEKYLNERGLTLELVTEKYGFELKAATTLYKKLKWEEGTPIRHLGGLWIPQYNPDGEPYGKAGQTILWPIQEDRKLNKYNTPGANNPSFIGNWRESNNDAPIVVCESIVKAIVVHECTQLLTVGLNGVYGWSAGRRSPHADLMDKNIWEDKPVIVLFDSLSTINPTSYAMVAAAKDSLNHVLSGLAGARILLADLPQIDPNEDFPKGQWGVDDFVVANGGEALVDLIREAREVEEEEASEQGRAVAAMNSMYAVLKRPSRIASRGDPGYLMTKADISLVYGNRTVRQTGWRNNNPVVQVVTIADAWLRSPRRLTLDTLVFQPGSENIVDNNLNLWTGFAIEADPDPGLASQYWYDVGVDAMGEVDMKVFTNLLAALVQHPEHKFGWQVFMQGKQGTGKNYLVEPLKAIFGKHLVQLSPEMYVNKFNVLLSAARVILFSEMPEGMDKKELHKLEQELKLEADTAPQFRVIEPKGAERVAINRNALMVMLSNYHPIWPVLRGDRRGLYLWLGDHMREVANGGKKLPVYWSRRWNWMLSSGAGEVYKFLLDWKVDWAALAGAPPLTDYKQRLYGAASIGDMEATLEEYLAGALEGPEGATHMRAQDLVRLTYGASSEQVVDERTVMSAGRKMAKSGKFRALRVRVLGSKEKVRLFAMPGASLDLGSIEKSIKLWNDYWGSK